MKDFELAYGTTTGNDHRWSGRNNQDAFCFCENDKNITAIVCDGCSEGKHNEVGAKIGAALLAHHINRILTGVQPEFFLWGIENSRRNTIDLLRDLTNVMCRSNDHLQFITDHFLFTAVGIHMNEEATMAFSIGDGVYYINDQKFQLGPFPSNEPPYLAYGGLVNSSLSDSPNACIFQPSKIYQTKDINHILLGTDGVLNLIDAQNKNIPGKSEAVGDINQFWTDDKYFQNSDMLRRKLALVNKETIKPIWDQQLLSKEKGLLPDDTTLVVIRRK
jgi:hypothetical protein